MARNETPLVMPGNSSCAGCGAVLIARLVTEAIGPNQIMVIPACCMGAVATSFPKATFNVPVLRTAFASTASFLTGLEASAKAKGQEVTLVGFAGDGATVDIGLAALSGAIERGHSFVYICYDNEGYMNTGFQRSGSTPRGAQTSTTPGGALGRYKAEPRKDIAKIVAAHGIPYLATASPAYPADLTRKVERAVAVKGPTFLHIMSPCPLGWGFPSANSVELARTAVESGLWKLYELDHGVLRLSLSPKKRKPVKEFFAPQSRFAHLSDDVYEELQRAVDEEWTTIEKEGFSLRCETSRA
ncbi:MAG: thiamine pyrophosphate-dependent enzyme [Candidatus Bipolaricaulota bacterium]|nr:thiamine pyrophosphate-dependent enzyme [Candidatus Bipolaricaulota bacterium]